MWRYYTGHMQAGGHSTDTPATYCQLQSLDRQLGSSVSWELQNKANILLQAQWIWNDSVTLLVMYKHQNAIKITPMLLGAAPLGHQQLYLMGNAAMIPQWLAAVTQWHLGPKPPFPMDTISWKGSLHWHPVCYGATSTHLKTSNVRENGVLSRVLSWCSQIQRES